MMVIEWVSIHGGIPNGWFISWNIPLRWMIQGEPCFGKPSYFLKHAGTMGKKHTETFGQPGKHGGKMWKNGRNMRKTFGEKINAKQIWKKNVEFMGTRWTPLEKISKNMLFPMKRGNMVNLSNKKHLVTSGRNGIFFPAKYAKLIGI